MSFNEWWSKQNIAVCKAMDERTLANAAFHAGKLEQGKYIGTVKIKPSREEQHMELLARIATAVEKIAEDLAL